MNLTPEERHKLDKLLAKEEKRGAQWRHGRWIQFFGGLYLVVCGLWVMSRACGIIAGAIPEDPTAPVDAFDVLAMWLRSGTFSMFTIFGLLHVPVGVVCGLEAVIHWRRGERNALLAKLARAWLDSHTTDAAPEEHKNEEDT
jgi:hypothetical protein